MSEEGEKTCPLCAEEMDLTDQQLKPCKCGYEICVWCWHHIMEMAEKNETEGRCPACRNPYNKEKIVGTSASCERLVSEMNVDKKLKSQKGRSKTSEGRKQLASVRVIQRNLVYVVGLPLNFADEDLLQRRDYFAQYGKVLKASMSRTAGGAIQQFPNSTCSVYITYSKEEEAVRCIQSVHGFVLDGRPLRASFGTTKYCHAWLRHMPCSNPDCLYLHDIGSTDDSFTKDEIISAYTRNKVQQITGSTNSLQRRSGNVLPPPLDDYCNNSSASSGKPITKTAVNANSNSVISARVSPPSSSSGRSAALPAGASWGTRSSNNQTSHTSMPSSNCSLKQKSDALTGAVPCSSAVSSLTQASTLHSDSGKMLVTNDENTTFPDEFEILEPPREESNTAERVNVSDRSFASVQSCSTPITRQPITRQSCSTPITRQPHDPPAKELPPSTTNIINSPSMPGGSVLNKDSVDALDENMENICSDILSMSVHENQQFQNIYPEHRREPLVSGQSGKAAITTDEMCVSSVQSDFRGGMPAEETQVSFDETEDDLLAFNNQRLKDPEVTTNRTLDFSNPVHLLKHSSQFNNDNGTIGNDFNWQFVDRERSQSVSTSNFPSGHLTNMLSSPEVNDSGYSNIFPRQEKKSLLGRYEGDVASGSFDMGESSIISNIFSMDFDPWNEPLSSPQNLGKISGETDERQGSFGIPGSRKSQNSNQSRFSFAREEEPMNQQSSFVKSNGYLGQGLKQHPFNCDFSGSTGLHLEKFASRNGFLVLNGMESDTLPSSHSHISSNKLSISRSQMSAPPGFSQPSRAAPPPGFSSHERTDQFFDTFSGNDMRDSSGLLRNQYQTPQSGNSINNGDIELIDPAIMAVGKGALPGGMHNSGLDIRSNFSPQLSAYEDSRFQSFLQTSLPSHHNQRFGDSFSPFSDTFGIPQTLANDLSHFSQFNLSQHRNGVTSNGQWDGNNLGMPELLRTERLGFNKFYGGYEDSKTRMPSSGNLYNGTYGI